MSRYTTQLKTICENYAMASHIGQQKTVDTIIALSRPFIFNFSYPIFNEEYRAVLETKILKHFYTREIGLETVGLWKLKLDTLLNEIMPYYNKMYVATSLKYDILTDTNIKTEHKNESENNNISSMVGNTTNRNNGNTVTNNKTNDISWNLFSDTPQGGVQGLENEDYLTNATKTTENNTNVNNVVDNSVATSYQNDITNFHANTTENYVQKISGKNGSNDYSEMVKKYIDNLVNVDLLVLRDLNCLFMNIW